MFGTGPAAEVGTGDVREAEVGLGVVVVTVEIFELAFEAEGGAEFDADAESGNIAENEAGAESGAESGDKTGAVEAGPEPKSAAELDLVVSVHDAYHKLSSEVAVAWKSGVSQSLGVVFEPRVGVAFVAASQTDHMMAPCENIQGALSEILTGTQLGATVVELELLDKPETVEPDLFAEGMVGELDASAGQWLGFVTLVWVSTVEMESDPVDNLGSSMEVVLQPVDAKQTLVMSL